MTFSHSPQTGELCREAEKSRCRSINRLVKTGTSRNVDALFKVNVPRAFTFPSPIVCLLFGTVSEKESATEEDAIAWQSSPHLFRRLADNRDTNCCKLTRERLAQHWRARDESAFKSR